MKADTSASIISSSLVSSLCVCLVARSCPTLCDPLDCSLPSSSVHGIFQARLLEWVTISSSRGSSQPRDQTRVSWTTGGFFTTWAIEEAASLTFKIQGCRLPRGHILESEDYTLPGKRETKGSWRNTGWTLTRGESWSHEGWAAGSSRRIWEHKGTGVSVHQLPER